MCRTVAKRMPLFSNFPLTVLVWDAKCHAMSRGWFANVPLVAFFTQPEDPVMSSVYPRSFSHIGLSVTDLDAAVNFYLGWPLFGLAQLYRAQAARAPSREA